MDINKGKTVFVIGGARSGKSRFALKTASACAGKKAYIATAQALDSEMEERIKKHRKERPDYWVTVEEPLNIAPVVKEGINRYDVVLVDCLTLWLSNLLHAEHDVDAEIDKFITFLKNPELLTMNYELFLVSNEVGMGIVPENDLARRFRDMAGTMNNKVAEAADEVYLVTAGIPLKIK